MITNKDIRVENGFLIINGDKYPLDGQSPEAIMAIVEDNSDTTPTEDSTAPITSGGVYAALDGSKIATLTQEFTDIDIATAWGSLYLSDLLTFDTSSLALTNAPKSVSLSIMSRSATAILIIDSVNAGNIKFFLSRVNAATAASFTISAIIVY